MAKFVWLMGVVMGFSLSKNYRCEAAAEGKKMPDALEKMIHFPNRLCDVFLTMA
ncbi:TPA: hypothetical protein HA242_01180 [Candidatus Woesearchaeota archaeon]|nr:hypothetical protein [Candidatus Woesearchaeota archaeon]